jgi:hypothetical protein
MTEGEGLAMTGGIMQLTIANPEERHRALAVVA